MAKGYFENLLASGHEPAVEVVVERVPRDENTDKRRTLRRAVGTLLAQVPAEPELHIGQMDGVVVAATKVTRHRHVFSTVTTWVVKVSVEGHVESYEAKELVDALSKASVGTEAYIDAAYLKW